MGIRMTSVVVCGVIAATLAVVFGIASLVLPAAPTDQPDLALVDILLLAFAALSLAAIAWSAFALLAAARGLNRTRLRQAAIARRIALAVIVLTPIAAVATAIVLAVHHNDHRLVGVTMSTLLGPVGVPVALLLGQVGAVARVTAALRNGDGRSGIG